jgi:hypothetical protein
MGRGIHADSAKIHEVFKGVITVFADAAHLLATGANHLSRFLNKRADYLDSRSYLLGNRSDFLKTLPAVMKNGLKQRHGLTICVAIPADMRVIGFLAHNKSSQTEKSENIIPDKDVQRR